ncbi:MAG: hypothetical protein FJX80_05515 [Bacteroidetes bacterium]|nr:hypothetical protein [Bacteroidota bacterium]
MKSKLGNFIFQNNAQYFDNFLPKNRIGEIRVGDNLSVPQKSPFQILGICESVGSQVNNGLPGAENSFHAFIEEFSLTQIHDSFQSTLFSFLGVVTIHNINLNFCSETVEELDEFVFEVLNKTITKEQIPIVIGGSHNNALPLMRWVNKNKSDFAVINIDAHADTRETHVRHSGNSFSFAINENTLSHYHVLGLHEAYNNAYIRFYLKENAKFFSYFEDYLFKKRNIHEDIRHISSSIKNIPCGIEIDTDAIVNFPSSAISPSGWTLNEMREILNSLTTSLSIVSYLHISEAAPLNKGERKMCGKAISYLVRDFILNFKYRI